MASQETPPVTRTERAVSAVLTDRPARRGFWVAAAALGLSLAAATAPTPLYSTYAANWHFSAITLTAVFAVYAVALLAALLAFGTLSDAIGRKPVIVLALGAQILSLICFICATGVGWLLAARIGQGLATGLASAAVSAALLDLQPPGKNGLGAFVNALTSNAGLGAGALISGALVEYAPRPQRLVYIALLVVVIVLMAAVAVFIDETVPERSKPKLWSRIAVPKGARPIFVTAVPCLTATLGLGGLYLSLGPSIAADLSRSHNHLLGGGVAAILCGTGALATAVLRTWSARACMITGCVALATGSAVTVVALAAHNPGLFYASTVVAGVGFGTGYLGSFRSVVALAEPEHRGELVSAVYIVLYSAFSVPIVVAGVLTTHIGLHETAIWFCAALASLALVALVKTLRTTPQIEAAAVSVTAGSLPGSRRC
ncbi:MFS transporter [Streptomyces sp. NPDC054775]